MLKRQKYKNLIMFAITLVIWGAQVGVWACTWMASYGNIIIRPFGYKGNWLVYAVYGLVAFCFTSIYGGYRIGYYKRGDVIFSHILSILIANGITYLQTCLIGRAIMQVMPFVWMTLVDCILIWVWASLAYRAYLRLYPPHNMLVIYGGDRLVESLIYKMTTRAEKYNICETVSSDEDIERIYTLIDKYQSVIICDVPSGQRNKLLKHCFEHSVRTYLTPKISDIIVRGAGNINLFDTPLLLCHNRGLSAEQRFVKRIIDIVISGLGILLASPLMLATAIAIKLQDGGPVLFRQDRCTINNKVFSICKFRSMVVDAEEDGKPRPAVKGDPRITTVGRFIRMTRIDELPQLFNIWVGDMSVVGPRPERIEHVSKYTAEIPEFAFRSKVKGGLTGYAQIVGKYNTTAYDKLKLDLMYIENYSLFMDIKLILMTIKIMFVRDSTEGFDKRSTPSLDETVRH